MRGWTKIMGKNQDGRDERMDQDQGMNYLFAKKVAGVVGAN